MNYKEAEKFPLPIMRRTIVHFKSICDKAPAAKKNIDAALDQFKSRESVLRRQHDESMPKVPRQ